MKLQLIWPILLMGLLSYYYSPVECRRRGGGRQRLPIKDEEGSRHVDKRKKASGMKMNPAIYREDGRILRMVEHLTAHA